MLIQARLENSSTGHRVTVSTDNASKSLSVSAKPDGRGSAINGGEILMTAIATCFCNDIYREAIRRNIEIRSIAVDVFGEFAGEGEPAKSISYSTLIDSPAAKADVQRLIIDVDRIAEIHNTLRKGITVSLKH